MSLLTRCPACNTIYKVVPDQLRISQGWVKCGQCGDIFDATQHLVHLEPEAKLPEVDQEKPQQSPPAPAPQTVEQPEDVISPAADELRESPVAGQAVPSETEQSIDVDLTASRDDTAALMDLTHDGTQVPGMDVSVADAMAESLAWPDPGPIEPSLFEPIAAEPTASAVVLQEPSFMRNARRARFWRRPWIRALLLTLALLLSLSLAAQWAYRERQFLSASHPQWTPVLREICQVFGCQIEALQRIESVFVDAASFSKIDDARYRLSFVLKNSADVPLAVPSIELTLTDLQERVVVRRVFAARELDSTVDRLRPTSEWQVNTYLKLDGDKNAQRVVGYRVLAFYP